jgi:phosphoribosyl 1,2-cyclic phosphodiesterase
MKFKFWGTRGSIPTPGPNSVKYGGNTTCIEVGTSGGELLILDAGTGIHALAQTLPANQPLTVHIFITHTHWDHIQGLPFFLPIFAAQNEIHIYGGQDPVTGQEIDRALTVQLQHSYFPISEAQLKADIYYHSLVAGQPVAIGSARITPLLLNHPVLNFGYRIDDDDGSSLFFTGDYEPLSHRYQPGDPEYRQAQDAIDATHRNILRVIDKVDALIIDSSYTDAEYRQRKGWGHGTYRCALSLAEQARAGKLFFTHHEPTRTDRQLDEIYQAILNGRGPSDLEIYLAREGEEHRLR